MPLDRLFEDDWRRPLRPQPPSQQPQGQPEEQAKGERVTAEPNKDNKDIEATDLNATVEGLGFFRLQLGAGQLRPVVPPQPTQNRQQPTFPYKILHVTARVLKVMFPLLLLVAVIFVIWQWLQGAQTPPIVSTSFEVFSFAFITSLVALGGVHLVSLQLQLNENKRNISFMTEKTLLTEPALVISYPETHRWHCNDTNTFAELKAIYESRFSDDNWAIKWIEMCLGPDNLAEFKTSIRDEMLKTNVKRKPTVHIKGDISLDYPSYAAIELKFITEERIPISTYTSDSD